MKYDIELVDCSKVTIKVKSTLFLISDKVKGKIDTTYYETDKIQNIQQF